MQEWKPHEVLLVSHMHAAMDESQIPFKTDALKA